MEIEDSQIKVFLISIAVSIALQGLYSSVHGLQFTGADFGLRVKLLKYKEQLRESVMQKVHRLAVEDKNDMDQEKSPKK